MTLDEFNWETPEVSTEDQELIDAYKQIGLPLDSLAYTSQFVDLVKLIGKDEEKDDELRQVFRRLLGLRKRGMLPRLYSGSSSSSSSSTSSD